MAEKQRRNSGGKKRGRGKPFQKGQSGNPLGRPKGTSLGDELRQLVEEQKDGKPNKRLLAEGLIALAFDGDTRAYALILDRVDGKAIDRHQFVGMSQEDINAFVAKVISLLRREIPDKCPHCMTPSENREQLAKMLAEVASDLQKQEPQ